LDFDLAARTLFDFAAPPFVQLAEPRFFSRGNGHFPGLLLQLLCYGSGADGKCGQYSGQGFQYQSSHDDDSLG